MTTTVEPHRARRTARQRWAERDWRLPTAVAAIALLAGVISGWNFGHRGVQGFYSAAARSMSLNWRAFFFGTFDPGATVTLDKLSGFLVPQAISARIFGFHPWSIALPQIVEGMVTVVVAYLIGSRWRGPRCGLLAAMAVTITPLLAAMFGRGAEDCMLTMSLALAFLCWQSSMLSGRLRPLLLAALWIAIGFQAKMMQAWLILPAIVIVYLIAAPHPLARRIRRASLMVGLTVVLSLSWITAIMLVPAADRPYIDGSTNNNGYSMVFGFNGFNRIVPDLIPGAVFDKTPAAERADTPSAIAAPARLILRINTGTGRAPALLARTTAATTAKPAAAVNTAYGPEGSPAKLVDAYFITQIGWFYPLMLAGLALGLWPVFGRRRRRSLEPSVTSARGSDGDEVTTGSADAADRPTPLTARSMDPAVATTLALGIWLVIAAVFLTMVRIPHTAYLSAIGVQVALLAAGGLWQAISMRSAGPRAARLALPALVGLQILWTIGLLLINGQAPGWMLPAVVLLGAAAVALLLARIPARRSVAVIALALVAVALAPSVWTGFVMTKSDTSEGDPYAGPHPQATPVGSAYSHVTDRSYGFDVPFRLYPDPALTRAQSNLARYVRAHPGVDGPMMATDRWLVADPYIEHDSLPVVPFGGYTGTVDTPTMGQLSDMINSGRLRFVLLHVVTPADKPAAGGLETFTGGFSLLGRYVLKLRDWVQANCRVVAASTYAGPKSQLTGEQLYACSPAAL